MSECSYIFSCLKSHPLRVNFRKLQICHSLFHTFDLKLMELIAPCVFVSVKQIICIAVIVNYYDLSLFAGFMHLLTPEKMCRNGLLYFPLMHTKVRMGILLLFFFKIIFNQCFEHLLASYLFNDIISSHPCHYPGWWS